MNIVILITIIFVICSIAGVFVTPEGGGKFFDKDYTTISKGIAILLIIISHCTGQWPAGRLLTPCGGIGVSMFLITSGYGLNESFKRGGLHGFWRRRLGRVYLPYLICAIVFAIVKKWNIETCLWSFSCIRCYYWYVTYIIECYIVYWFASRFFLKYRMWVFLFISILALFFMPELQAEQSFGFVTGIWLSENRERLLAFRQNSQLYMTMTFGLLFIGILFLVIKQIPAVRNESSAIVMNTIQCFIKYPLGLCALFAIGYSRKVLSNPFLYFSGLISYELYLVHFPFYTYIGNRLWPAFMLIAVSYLVAYLFYRFNNIAHTYIR